MPTRGNHKDELNSRKNQIRTEKLENDWQNGNGISEVRRIDIKDVFEWERYMRKIKWNVYISNAEEARRTSAVRLASALLPSLITEDNFNPPVDIPKDDIGTGRILSIASAQFSHLHGAGVNGVKIW